jgi:hypothetical protein
MRAYVGELYWLAEDIVSRFDGVFEKTPPPQKPGANYIKVDPHLHADIYAALGSAAKIRSLIRERGKRRDQDTNAHRLLVDRSRGLLGLLQGLQLRLIRSADARHSLEHFDERIDYTAEQMLTGKIPLPAYVPMDMAVWDLCAFETISDGRVKGMFPLRLYVASERRFLNAGAEIDLGQLRDEAASMVDRLRPLIKEEERGGFIIVVTPQSFEGL